MRRCGDVVIAAVAIASSVATIVAQEALPTFEVASVRQNTGADGREVIQMLPGGRVTLANVPRVS